MKKLLMVTIVTLMVTSVTAQDYKPVAHVSTVAFTTIAVQNAFNLEWKKAAFIGYTAGLFWNYSEGMEYHSFKKRLAYNVAGVLLSYPFRNTRVFVSDHGIGLSIKF